MARKKAPEKAPNHERWLVSYADFITLLFAVFVTLYAMSQTDKQKVVEVAASYRSAFGLTAGKSPGRIEIIEKSDPMVLPSDQFQVSNTGETDEPQSSGEVSSGEQAEYELLIDTLTDLAGVEQTPTGKINLIKTRRGLVIRLPEAVLFSNGSDEIKPEGFPLLAAIADALKPLEKQISFEGYSDNQTSAGGRYDSGFELSVARAESVARYFVEGKAFSYEDISVSGFGGQHPIADNRTEQGRQMNRRLEIVIHGLRGAAQPEKNPLAQ